MTLPVLNRLLSSSPKHFLLALVVFGTCATANAQTNPLTQTFTQSTADANFPFTASPALGSNGSSGYFSTVRGAASTSEKAYGVSTTGGSVSQVTVNFVEKTFNFASTINQLSFDMAALSTGSGNKGFSNSTFIEVFLSINRSGFPASPQLLITGSNPNGDNFNLGTGNPYIYPGTVIATSPTVTLFQGNTAVTHFTTATLALPTTLNAGTRVQVRFVISTTNSTSIIIDNVALTSSSTISTLPLPVELTRFDATIKDQSVNVSWATASEKNNDHFDVQRGATGSSYKTIGSVQGHGNSTAAHDYAFVDSRPLAGLSYYRLRQVDADGSSDYSPVATVQSDAGQKAIAFPNPSTGTITLPALDGPIQYRIYNNVGQTLLSGQAIGNEQFDITKIPRGTFFLELTSQSGRTTQRLVRE